MAQLNTTHTQKILNENGLDHTVYNLAFAGDKPEKRLLELDEIVDLEPEMIVYGLGYRDFSHYTSNKDSILPDLQDEFHNLGEKITLGYNFPSNPKFVTLSTIKDILEKTDQTRGSEDENRPFFDDDANLLEIKNTTRITQELNSNNDPSNKLIIRKTFDNINFLALQKIISDLNDKKINTVLYITPQHPSFTESIDKNEKYNFDMIFEFLENEKNVIYDFEEKYNDEEIWADSTHIAYNKNSLKFSEDMAKIIIENIDS